MHLPYADGDYDVLESVLGGSDNFAAQHRVIKTDIFFNRRCPEWAKHDIQVRGLLLRVFPKLKTNNLQRKRAARWALVISLFFREGRSEAYLADIMGITIVNVRSLVRSIKRATRGLRCRDAKARKSTV